MSKWILATLSILALQGLGYAVPSISGVTGAFTHDTVMTISCTGCGTVSSATAVFDSFENGTRNAYWNVATFTTKLGVNNDVGQRSTLSTFFSSHNLTTNSGSGGQACLQGSNSITDRRWYVSYWFKLGADWNFGAELNENLWRSFLSNIKVFRLWAPGAEVENTFFAFNGGEANGQLEVHHEALTGENIDYAKQNISTPAANMALNTWHKFTFEYTDSVVAGQANGSYKWIYDGAVIKSRTGVLLSEDEVTGGKRPQVVGMQNEWGCTGTDCNIGNNSYYIDDMVVRAGTLSRAIISTNSTINTGGIEEEQEILTWADTSVTVRAKVSMLENFSGSTKYLYVCDDAGACSGAFDMTGIGGGGGGGGASGQSFSIKGGINFPGGMYLK